MMSRHIQLAFLMMLVVVLYQASGASLISPAAAHDPRPVLIDIYQDDARPGDMKLEWKIPGSLSPRKHPIINFETACNLIRNYPERFTGEAYYGGADFLCSGYTPNLSPKLTLTYPLGNPSLSSFVRLYKNNLEGDQKTAMFLLKPDELSWAIPQSLAPSSASSSLMAQAYLELGFSHILQGWDHLLFIICLMALAIMPKKIFLAVTGFTIGHSLTLAAASLNFLTLPVIYVETLISLSIILVCVELLQSERKTLARSYPVLISLFFGLVHGLGFANELISVGFPADGFIAALLYFNIGVEVGQIIFVVLAMSLVFGVRKLIGFSRNFYETMGFKLIFYTIGFIACYWFVESSMQFSV